MSCAACKQYNFVVLDAVLHITVDLTQDDVS
jgi:hypothetical protein